MTLLDRGTQNAMQSMLIVQSVVIEPTLSEDIIRMMNEINAVSSNNDKANNTKEREERMSQGIIPSSKNARSSKIEVEIRCRNSCVVSI